jgi:hypothetical protein
MKLVFVWNVFDVIQIQERTFSNFECNNRFVFVINKLQKASMAYKVATNNRLSRNDSAVIK